MKTKLFISIFVLVLFPTLLLSQIGKFEYPEDDIPLKQPVISNIEAEISQELVTIRSSLSSIEDVLQMIDIQLLESEENEDLSSLARFADKSIDKAISYGNQAIDATIKVFDLSATGVILTTGGTSSVSLNEELRRIESMQEDIRAKRQLNSSAFQNFDQKANQLFYLLSEIMKSFNEMRRSTSLLGG